VVLSILQADSTIDTEV